MRSAAMNGKRQTLRRVKGSWITNVDAWERWMSDRLYDEEHGPGNPHIHNVGSQRAFEDPMAYVDLIVDAERQVKLNV